MNIFASGKIGFIISVHTLRRRHKIIQKDVFNERSFLLRVKKEIPE